MTIQATLPRINRRSPSLQLPRWPLRLGRLLLSAMNAYAEASCVAYATALGLKHKQEPMPRDLDY